MVRALAMKCDQKRDSSASWRPVIGVIADTADRDATCITCTRGARAGADNADGYDADLEENLIECI
jgi:hypothetical protein